MVVTLVRLGRSKTLWQRLSGDKSARISTDVRTTQGVMTSLEQVLEVEIG
jgi:hypothetical protein